MPMSISALIDAQNRVSAALAAPVAEAIVPMQNQLVKNADETPWWQDTVRAYLWVFVCHVARHRLSSASHVQRQGGQGAAGQGARGAEDRPVQRLRVVAGGPASVVPGAVRRCHLLCRWPWHEANAGQVFVRSSCLVNAYISPKLCSEAALGAINGRGG